MGAGTHTATVTARGSEGNRLPGLVVVNCLLVFLCAIKELRVGGEGWRRRKGREKGWGWGGTH